MSTKYTKRDKIYYENVYITLLERLKKSQDEAAKELSPKKDSKISNATLKKIKDCKLNTRGFFNKGLSGKADIAENYTNEQKQFAEIEARIHKKFAQKNVKYWDKVEEDKRTPEEEIQRIRNGKNARFIVKVIAVGAIATAVICGVVKGCSKKTTTTETSSSVTTENTEDTAKNTSDNTTNTTPSETTTNRTFGTSDNDESKAMESIIDDQKGIVIVDPTTGETTIYYYDDNSNTNGNGYTGNSNSGNNGGSSTTTTTTTSTTVTEGTTETTKATESTTGTTATQPTINGNGETVPTTSINKEPEYSESNGGKDVVINNYDDVQPSYIEEDPTQTYETFFYIPEEDIVYDEQVDAYTLTLRK